MTNNTKSIVLIAEQLARSLHEGKEYGKNSNMYEQIKSLVTVLDEYTTLQGTDKENLLAAAWLSKSIEPSKLAPGKEALSLEAIADACGQQTAEIVNELCTQEKKEKDAEKAYKQSQLNAGVPEDALRKEPKDSVWLKKSQDAIHLSHGAREILMAEKQSNFINDADTSHTKKGYAWHIEYYMTRMLMVEALKDTNPKLYKDLRDLAVTGIAAHIADGVEKEGLKAENICQDLVRDKSDIMLSEPMIKIMSERPALVQDAYHKAKQLLNEKGLDIPVMPKPKDMPSYKRRVLINLKTGTQTILNKRYKAR